MTGLQHFNKEQKKAIPSPMFNYHFGVHKKKSWDHFGVDLGIISGWGSFRGRDPIRGLHRSQQT